MDEIDRRSRPDVPARSIFRTRSDARQLERHYMTMRVPIRRRMAAWRQGIVVTTVVRRDPPGAAARHHPPGAAARRWWALGARRSAPAALRRWIAAALAVLVGVAVELGGDGGRSDSAVGEHE